MNQARTATLLLVSVTVLVARPTRAEIRTWTDSTGAYKLEAEFVEEKDGNVRLKRTDGRIVALPVERLSAADQAYVRKQRAGTEPPTPKPDLLTPSAIPVTLELLSGAQVTGRITANDAESITIEAVVSGRTFTRKYPRDRIRAVAKGEERVLLNESSGESTPPAADSSSRSPSSSGTSGKRAPSSGGPAKSIVTTGSTRSRAQIENLIEEMGRSPPDWWEATPLNYPKTLDLSWPEKAPDHNPQKHIGQYLGEIIHPNENKWREGIRFVHFLLEQHEGDRAKCERDMVTLGRLYYLLLQDYARAAFWWRKAGVDRNPNQPLGVFLADCYFRLGSKPMALEFMNRMGRSNVPVTAIKQLADMGETRAAIQLADAAVRGGLADLGYLYAGDACRIEGQFDQAIRYYERVLQIPLRGNDGEVKHIQRAQQRARVNIEAIRVFDKLDLKRIPDGKYRGAAPAYASELQVEVTVHGGRLEDVKVIRHEEKQYYAAMLETPRKIILRQGVRGVDATTGATITSEAIINATAKALASSLKQ